jgi:hypothetical protein
MQEMLDVHERAFRVTPSFAGVGITVQVVL